MLEEYGFYSKFTLLSFVVYKSACEISLFEKIQVVGKIILIDGVLKQIRGKENFEQILRSLKLEKSLLALVRVASRNIPAPIRLKGESTIMVNIYHASWEYCKAFQTSL